MCNMTGLYKQTARASTEPSTNDSPEGFSIAERTGATDNAETSLLSPSGTLCYLVLNTVTNIFASGSSLSFNKVEHAPANQTILYASE